MAHEIAKMLLEHARTFLDRQEAISAALGLGMPLNEIEEYLDWLDLMRKDATNASSDGRQAEADAKSDTEPDKATDADPEADFDDSTGEA